MLTPTIENTRSSQVAQRTTQQDLGKKDIFLKLLVAQMQFQDPLKPQDPTQMSSQLAQFNMVEQQTDTNRLLEKLLAASGSGSAATTQATTGAGYLGHQAVFSSNTLSYQGGSASFELDLAAGTSQTRVQIVDEQGTPVRTLDLGPLPAGTHQVVWDGRMQSGATADAGVYRILVAANDSSGTEIDTKIMMQGLIEAVRFTSQGPEYVIGGIPVAQADIEEIRL